MNGALSTASVVAALALAASCAVTALRNRTAGRPHEIGAAAVEVVLVALVAVTVASIIGGHRPEDPVVFGGYAVATLGLLPGGVVLARMEPTRWGAATLGGAALVVPLMILRLQQLYG